MVSARGQQAPGGQYLGAGGVNTWVGVRLNPKLPEPAAGYYYRPSLRHLRNGYRGELVLANRIVHALPNEIVIHYGMPAGLQGPDVISINLNGTVSVWDSKWRTGQRSISPGQRGHQSATSLDDLYWEIRKYIRMAVRSGHLPPDVGAAAMKNMSERNFDIYTVGTGNAHSGVAQSVRNGVPTSPRRP
jgi:filamentous hemagglutinin